MTGAYDLAILGGGPGGYATALRAAHHGLRSVIVEADQLGGTCLHRGCIPSKALLHIGHLADTMPRLIEMGLAAPGAGLDLASARRFSDDLVGRLFRGLEQLIASRDIDVIRGWGRVTREQVVVVDDASIDARNIVIATGSAPVQLPLAPRDGERILLSDDALRLSSVPGRALVLGAGAVGIELASLWCSLGAHVTVVEQAERVLPLEDPDSSTALARAFKRRGIDIRTNTSLEALDVHDAVDVHLSDGSTLTVDQLLIAVGRRPATAGLGLEELGVLDAQGFVRVDRFGRTDLAGLWAVGDATSTLALAHAAFAEGFVVADAVAGVPTSPVDHTMVPRVTYSTPEVASVGLTEPEARVAHAEVTATTTSFSGNARALIEGVGGHVKLIADGDGTLLGAHVVGPSATELIAELSLAAAWGALAEELGAVAHAHPSLSEAAREAALLAAAGSPFHAHR